MIVEAQQDALFTDMERRAIPVMGHLHLTEKCNLHCAHCYRIGLPVGGEMTTDEWIRILGELRAAGTMQLTFSGGEPLVHRGWRAVIAEAHRHRFRYEVFTNGTVMADGDLDFLKDHGVTEMHFSIHGSAEVHDRFVRHAGAFARAWPRVRESSALGLKTVVKMSLTQSTLPGLSGLAAFCREAGVIFAPSYHLIPRFVPGNDDFLSDRLTATQIRQVESEYTGLTGRPELSSLDCEDDRYPTMCNMGWSRFAIGPLGDLFPCSQVAESVGNVRHTSFHDVWRGSERLNEIRGSKGKTIETCSSCSMLSACKFRCMGHFQQATGHYDRPSPTHCEITAAWLGLDAPERSRAPMTQPTVPSPATALSTKPEIFGVAPPPPTLGNGNFFEERVA